MLKSGTTTTMRLIPGTPRGVSGALSSSSIDDVGFQDDMRDVVRLIFDLKKDNVNIVNNKIGTTVNTQFP